LVTEGIAVATRSKTPKAAAVYCRISLDKGGEGLGVERQEALCRRLAKERGWPVAEVYVDNDRSAFNGKPRPAYTRMVADLEAGARDAVVCVDLDRLTRRPAELEAFMELADRCGIALANVSGDTDLSTSDGRFKARIMGAVARQESERKGERVAREAQHAARRGVPRGSRRPFGYESDRVTIREDEATLIRDAVERVLRGETVPSIARDWNAREIPSPQQAAHGWSATTVKGILRNPRIAGLRTYKHEVVAEGCWPAVVDRDTFERLQAKIRRTSRPGRSPKRLLSAIARCGRCGAPLWTSARNDAYGRTPRYACIKRPGAPGCGATTVVAEPLDELITEAVLHRLGTKAMARALSRKPKRTKAEPDLVGIERDLDDLASDFGAGRISRREWLSARKPLEERLARARRAVDATSGTAALGAFRDTDVRDTWERLDVDRRRAVLSALVDRIVINPAKRPVFDPDRVDVVWRA
jgi:DNA invertase Pin-like site-specific DNA recombinase